VNAVKCTSGTSASLTQRCSSSSKTAFGYSIVCQASSEMLAIAVFTVAVMRAVTLNQAPWRSAVPTNAWP
jgi:hypothetical protein